MSIINDALKKAQQGLKLKADEQQTASPGAPSDASGPASVSGPWSSPSPVRKAPPVKNKAKSILPLLCAIAFAIGAFAYLCKEVNVYFPQLQKKAKASFYKMIGKEEAPAFKAKPSQDLVPLARITVNSSKAANLPIPTNPLPGANAAATEVPVTLNVHGVMSNGSSNAVLIDDQVYQEGDNVDGIKIVKINLNSIEVINNGKEETIRVKN